MIRRLLLVHLVAAAALATACGGAEPTTPTPIVVPPPEPPPPPPPPVPVLGVTRILAFGDSMTEGVTSPTFGVRMLTAGLPQSYPYKLQTLVSARYTSQTVVVLNAGFAGKLATEDWSRFNAALSEAKPELLLLMEGANDLNGVAPSVTAAVNAMEDMVREAGRRGIFVMLATIPPQRPGHGSNTTSPDVLARYNSSLRTMAANKGAQLIDVNALLPVALIGKDGLHPTEAGYERLAEIFFDAIKTKYEKTSTALR